MALSQKYYRTEHAVNVLSGMECMRREGLICDFTIQVGLKLFPVHRTIIAACSKYFKAMLSHDMMEARKGIVNMKDIAACAMEKCIQFMYSGEIELELDTIADVLHGATFLQLELLTTICFDFLRSILCVENAIFAKEIAQAYSNPELLQLCEEFIAGNFTDISKTDDFLSRPPEEIKKYIKTLDISVEIAWQALVTWTNHNISGRKETLIALLEMLCGKTVSLRVLLISFWKEDIVQRSQRCRNIVRDCLLSDVKRLKENIDLDTCFYLKEITKNCNQESAAILADEVKFFIVDNFENISKMEDWKSLTKYEVSELLQARDLACTSEKVKWDALLSWTRHEGQRKRHFPELLKLLDFSLLSNQFIHETVRHEVLVRESNACMSMVMDALADMSRQYQKQEVQQVQQVANQEIGDVMEEVDDLALQLDNLVQNPDDPFVGPPQLPHHGNAREVPQRDEVSPETPRGNFLNTGITHGDHLWDYQLPPPPHHRNPFRRRGHPPPHHYPPPPHIPPPHHQPPHHPPLHHPPPPPPPNLWPPHPHRGCRGRRGWRRHHHHHPSNRWGPLMHSIVHHRDDTTDEQGEEVGLAFLHRLNSSD